MNIPPATRPSLSGYINEPMLLPWAWVSRRMSEARNYWIGTHNQGYPNSRPVWGIWVEPRLLFSSGSTVSRNIQKDSRVQINLESGAEVVLIEGVARPLKQRDLDIWVREYNRKYAWDMPSTVEGVFEVQPTRVLAWVCDESGLDGGALFNNSATEWNFEG